MVLVLSRLVWGSLFLSFCCMSFLRLFFTYLHFVAVLRAAKERISTVFFFHNRQLICGCGSQSCACSVLHAHTSFSLHPASSTSRAIRQENETAPTLFSAASMTYVALIIYLHSPSKPWLLQKNNARIIHDYLELCVCFCFPQNKHNQN